MQCASCRFENMPGVETCGRCGSTLRLATAVLDVHPPRARPWQKRLRRLLPWRWAAAGARDARRRAGRRATGLADRYEVTLPPAGVLARLAVPGLAQFHLGEAGVGRLVLAAYVPLLLLGLAFFGTLPGSLLLGLALSVHASSAVAVLLRYKTPVGVRVALAVAVLAALGLGVYGPAAWAVTRVAMPLTIEDAADPLQAGDVVLCNRAALWGRPPRPGDVVLYRTGPLQGRMAMPGGGLANVYVAGGDRIDRVLAGPGSAALWKDGRFLVDGAESDLGPLNPARVPAELSLRVPPGCYLIFPSTVPRVDPRATPEIWRHVCVVPEREIRGTVYLRTQPPSRFGRIR
jgi:hypothetical protein